MLNNLRTLLSSPPSSSGKRASFESVTPQAASATIPSSTAKKSSKKIAVLSVSVDLEQAFGQPTTTDQNLFVFGGNAAIKLAQPPPRLARPPSAPSPYVPAEPTFVFRRSRPNAQSSLAPHAGSEPLESSGRRVFETPVKAELQQESSRPRSRPSSASSKTPESAPGALSAHSGERIVSPSTGEEEGLPRPKPRKSRTIVLQPDSAVVPDEDARRQRVLKETLERMDNNTNPSIPAVPQPASEPRRKKKASSGSGSPSFTERLRSLTVTPAGGATIPKPERSSMLAPRAPIEEESPALRVSRPRRVSELPASSRAAGGTVLKRQSDGNVNVRHEQANMEQIRTEEAGKDPLLEVRKSKGAPLRMVEEDLDPENGSRVEGTARRKNRPDRIAAAMGIVAEGAKEASTVRQNPEGESVHQRRPRSSIVVEPVVFKVTRRTPTSQPSDAASPSSSSVSPATSPLKSRKHMSERDDEGSMSGKESPFELMTKRIAMAKTGGAVNGSLGTSSMRMSGRGQMMASGGPSIDIESALGEERFQTTMANGARASVKEQPRRGEPQPSNLEPPAVREQVPVLEKERSTQGAMVSEMHKASATIAEAREKLVEAVPPSESSPLGELYKSLHEDAGARAEKQAKAASVDRASSARPRAERAGEDDLFLTGRVEARRKKTSSRITRAEHVSALTSVSSPRLNVPSSARRKPPLPAEALPRLAKTRTNSLEEDGGHSQERAEPKPASPKQSAAPPPSPERARPAVLTEGRGASGSIGSAHSSPNRPKNKAVVVPKDVPVVMGNDSDAFTPVMAQPPSEARPWSPVETSADTTTANANVVMPSQIPSPTRQGRGVPSPAASPQARRRSVMEAATVRLPSSREASPGPSDAKSQEFPSPTVQRSPNRSKRGESDSVRTDDGASKEGVKRSESEPTGDVAKESSRPSSPLEDSSLAGRFRKSNANSSLSPRNSPLVASPMRKSPAFFDDQETAASKSPSFVDLAKSPRDAAMMMSGNKSPAVESTKSPKDASLNKSTAAPAHETSPAPTKSPREAFLTRSPSAEQAKSPHPSPVVSTGAKSPQDAVFHKSAMYEAHAKSPQDAASHKSAMSEGRAKTPPSVIEERSVPISAVRSALESLGEFKSPSTSGAGQRKSMQGHEEDSKQKSAADTPEDESKPRRAESERSLALRVRQSVDARRADEALSLCDEWKKLNPRASEAWFLSGRAHLLKGEVSPSEQHFANALRLATQEQDETIRQGAAREMTRLRTMTGARDRSMEDLSKRNGASALSHASRAREIAPLNAQLCVLRAAALLVASVSPSAPLDLATTGDGAVQSAQVDAEKELDLAFSLTSDSISQIGRPAAQYARAMHRSGLAQEADLLLEETCNRVRGGEKSAPLSMCVELLRLFRSMESAKSDANDAYKRGQYSEAVRLYTKALELDPVNDVFNAVLLSNRAACHVAMSEYARAVVDCDSALKLIPTFQRARIRRARALMKMNKFREAISDLELAMRVNPSSQLAEELSEARKAMKEYGNRPSFVRQAFSEGDFGSIPRGQALPRPPPLPNHMRRPGPPSVPPEDDLYRILGVTANASGADIKKAYHRAALKHHPDKNVGDDQANQRFKKVLDAFHTLSDPASRRKYDLKVNAVSVPMI